MAAITADNLIIWTNYCLHGVQSSSKMGVSFRNPLESIAFAVAQRARYVAQNMHGTHEADEMYAKEDT